MQFFKCDVCVNIFCLLFRDDLRADSHKNPVSIYLQHLELSGH